MDEGLAVRSAANKESVKQLESNGTSTQTHRHTDREREREREREKGHAHDIQLT